MIQGNRRGLQYSPTLLADGFLTQDSDPFPNAPWNGSIYFCPLRWIDIILFATLYEIVRGWDDVESSNRMFRKPGLVRAGTYSKARNVISSHFLPDYVRAGWTSQKVSLLCQTYNLGPVRDNSWKHAWKPGSVVCLWLNSRPRHGHWMHARCSRTINHINVHCWQKKCFKTKTSSNVLVAWAILSVVSDWWRFRAIVHAKYNISGTCQTHIALPDNPTGLSAEKELALQPQIFVRIPTYLFTDMITPIC